MRWIYTSKVRHDFIIELHLIFSEPGTGAGVKDKPRARLSFERLNCDACKPSKRARDESWLGGERGAPPPRPKYACLLDLVVGGGPGC